MMSCSVYCPWVFVLVFLPCVVIVACVGLLFWCLTCPVMSYVNMIGVVFIVALLVVGVIVVVVVVGWKCGMLRAPMVTLRVGSVCWMVSVPCVPMKFCATNVSFWCRMNPLKLSGIFSWLVLLGFRLMLCWNGARVNVFSMFIGLA